MDEGKTCIGLLNLRADRGDRSLLWADSLAEGALDRFDVLFLHGLHGPAVRHRLKGHPGRTRIRLLKPGAPAEIMEQIVAARGGEGGVLFGFGNIGGLGRDMVRYWNKVGVPNGV
jgi:hypothetical protein